MLEINFLHVLADSSLEKKTSSVGDWSWSWTTMKDFLATQNMENIIKLYGQEKSEKVCKFYVSAGLGWIANFYLSPPPVTCLPPTFHPEVTPE